MKRISLVLGMVLLALIVFYPPALTRASLDETGVLSRTNSSRSSHDSASEGEAEILEFETMVGVPRPFTGLANAIRGVAGGGLPWVISKGEGELEVNGRIEVKVEGLVLDPNDLAVIARGLGGINPVPFFKAIVSCLSVDEEGNAVIRNVESDLFPADEEGNSEIESRVDLPVPCIAPIIFVTSPGGAWFATTGF